MTIDIVNKFSTLYKQEFTKNSSVLSVDRRLRENMTRLLALYPHKNNDEIFWVLYFRDHLDTDPLAKTHLFAYLNAACYYCAYNAYETYRHIHKLSHLDRFDYFQIALNICPKEIFKNFTDEENCDFRNQKLQKYTRKTITQKIKEQIIPAKQRQSNWGLRSKASRALSVLMVPRASTTSRRTFSLGAF